MEYDRTAFRVPDWEDALSCRSGICVTINRQIGWVLLLKYHVDDGVHVLSVS